MHISVEAIRTCSRKPLTSALGQIIHVCSTLSLLVFGGCAVLQGAPTPATDVAQENTAFAIYLTGDVLERAVSPNNADRNGMTQLEWRDAVIAARLQIMDQNFQAFKSQLGPKSRVLTSVLIWRHWGSRRLRQSPPEGQRRRWRQLRPG
jgi:hypothetical protein